MLITIVFLVLELGTLVNIVGLRVKWIESSMSTVLKRSILSFCQGHRTTGWGFLLALLYYFWGVDDYQCSAVTFSDSMWALPQANGELAPWISILLLCYLILGLRSPSLLLFFSRKGKLPLISSQLRNSKIQSFVACFVNSKSVPMKHHRIPLSLLILMYKRGITLHPTTRLKKSKL